MTIFVIGIIFAILVGRRNKLAAGIVITLTFGLVMLLSLQTNKSLEKMHKAEIQRVINERGGQIISINTEVLSKNMKYSITYTKDGEILQAIYIGTKTINDIHARDRYGNGEKWTFLISK